MNKELLFSSRLNFLNMIVDFLNTNNEQTISISSDWGSGKTFFLNKLIGDLDKDNNIETIYFDCWEHQGSRNVESILIESVYEELNRKVYEDKWLEKFIDAIKINISNLKPEQQIKFITKTLKIISTFSKCSVINHLIPENASELISGIIPVDIKQQVNGILDESLKFILNQTKKMSELSELDFLTQHNNLILDEYEVENNFYDILYSLLIATNKKVVLIFDELDRCEPTFAMNLVKKIAYMNKKFHLCAEDLNCENSFNIIISVNKNEFIHIMKHYYGEYYSAEAYFDKLFDYEFELPAGEQYKVTLNSILTTYSMNDLVINKFIKNLLMKNNYRKANLLDIEFCKTIKAIDKNQIFNSLGERFLLLELIFTILSLKIYSYSDYYKLKENTLQLGEIFVNLMQIKNAKRLCHTLMNETVFTGSASDTNSYLKTLEINDVNYLINEINKYNITNTVAREISVNVSPQSLDRSIVINKDQLVLYMLFYYLNM